MRPRWLGGDAPRTAVKPRVLLAPKARLAKLPGAFVAPRAFPRRMDIISNFRGRSTLRSDVGGVRPSSESNRPLAGQAL